jgi:hypothetical protein
MLAATSIIQAPQRGMPISGDIYISYIDAQQAINIHLMEHRLQTTLLLSTHMKRLLADV